MIFCKRCELGLYLGLSTSLDEAITTVLSLNLAEISPGRKDISENVYINCMEYETCVNDRLAFEVHEKYGDIHLSLNGTEVIYTADVKNHTIITADKDNDYLSTEGEWESCIRLTPDDVLIVFPGEAHRLKGCLTYTELIKKLVVKFMV